jgi:hypothetical protein
VYEYSNTSLFQAVMSAPSKSGNSVSVVVPNLPCDVSRDAAISMIIIPPVLGVVVGLILVLVGVFVFQRRQKNRDGFLACVIIGSIILGSSFITLCAVLPAVVVVKDRGCAKTISVPTSSSVATAPAGAFQISSSLLNFPALLAKRAV